MSLIEGEMKEEDGWARLLPLIAALTKRRIGQVWMHHTGHDASHGYGTKTREWRMDTVMFLSEVQNPEADISFSLEFTKARERTPQTRRDYVPVTVTLADDEWVGSAAAERERKVTGAKKVALDLLRKAIAEAGSVPPASNHVPPNTRTIPVEIWRAYSYQGNVTDSDKPDARQKAFVRAAKALQASNSNRYLGGFSMDCLITRTSRTSRDISVLSGLTSTRTDRTSPYRDVRVSGCPPITPS